MMMVVVVVVVVVAAMTTATAEARRRRLRRGSSGSRVARRISRAGLSPSGVRSRFLAYFSDSRRILYGPCMKVL
jgi:threonine/homoserine/homoserine lactone efflux protein